MGKLRRKRARKDLTGLESLPPSLVDAVSLAGAVAGAATGAIAGPVGVVAGGAVGAAIGAMAGAVMEQESHRQFVHDEVLDEEIGVIDGEMGAADPKAPPARIGAFSGVSAGGGTLVEDAPVAEGPFVPPDGA